MPFSRKTDDERAAAAAQKEQRQRVADERKRAEAIEKARKAFLATPAGRARAAFERGDDVFQYSIDVMNQQAIIVAMVGSTTSKKTSDPTDVLNSVCREGWELVNGSFVFVEQGQQSRDKFLSSGQNIAVKGEVVGYYLFKRNEEKRQMATAPWLAGGEEAVLTSAEDPLELEAGADVTVTSTDESAEAHEPNELTPQAEPLAAGAAAPTVSPADAEPAGSEPPYWPPPPDWQPPENSPDR